MTQRLQKYSKAFICLFFTVIVLLGLLTIGDYGRTWDELGEMRIFRMAIMEYGKALPFETSFYKTLGDMGIVPLSQSIEMDHNFSLYYPIAWAACNPAMDDPTFTMIWRGHTWLIFVLGLFALYAICRHMGLSRPLCCAAVLLLLLTPRFFADGHYNNKDLALMTSAGLVLWQTLRLAEKPTYPRALLFAVAAGFCVNTRIIGAAVCGLCGLLIILRLALMCQFNRRVVGVGLCALLGSLACYALLTPALLNDPAAYLSYVVRNSLNFTRWNGTVLFMGREISLAAEKPPFYYLPVMLVITTPVLQLLLTGLGGLLSIRCAMKKKLAALTEDDSFAAIASLLVWLLPLLACIVLRTRIYNGWRHFYFIYLPIVATAAWGMRWLWSRTSSSVALRRALAGGCAVLLLAQGVLLCLNHPYQYAYYNPLVSRKALAQRYDLDYYNISLLQAVQQLLALEKDAPVIRVACGDERTRSGFALNITLLSPEDAARIEYVPYDESQRHTFYTLVNTSYGVMAGFQPTADMQPVISIQSYGATLCTVYASERTKEVLP